MANHPVYPGRRMVRQGVHLPEHLREVARRLGQGNISRGVCLALERLEKQEQKGEGK